MTDRQSPWTVAEPGSERSRRGPNSRPPASIIMACVAGVGFESYNFLLLASDAVRMRNGPSAGAAVIAFAMILSFIGLWRLRFWRPGLYLGLYLYGTTSLVIEANGSFHRAWIGLAVMTVFLALVGPHLRKFR